MVAKSSTKVAQKFECNFCDYNTVRKCNYEKHLSSHKHIHRTLLNTLEQKSSKKEDFFCKTCNKRYTVRNSLWYHEKKCNPVPAALVPATLVPATLVPDEIKTLTTMVMELMKSNAELQKQLVDVCKQNNTTISNSNNITHSNNKTFNLQFFLNEQCKDAMNMSDFVNTFELRLSDLESVGDLGYVEGISKIIVERLNSMDIYKRPMHCSDAKRETLYIKDADKWEKEAKHNPKLRKAIQTVSFKNMKLVTTWSDTYPESKNSESRLNDRYMKLIKQSTGGNGDNADNEDKIIRRIAKEIVIEK